MSIIEQLIIIAILGIILGLIFIKLWSNSLDEMDEIERSSYMDMMEAHVSAYETMKMHEKMRYKK